LRGRDQAAKIISYHALENHLYAQLVELLGKIERVRIHAVGCQQLGSNRNDLSVHG
jgi:hypothetical protein